MERTLLIPAVGFLVVLGVAFLVAQGASAKPEAKLHARVQAYLRALYDGDAREAAGYRADRNPGVEVRRAERRKGAKYFVATLEVAADGAEARVHVLWLTEEDQIRAQEIETWRPDAEGRWALWAFDRAP